MRLTRAAQRAQQVDEPTTDATEVKDRTPLNEISPNASPELVAPEEAVSKKTPARTKSKKGGKKGGKGRKVKVEEEEEQAQAVLGHEPQALETVENAAVEEPSKTTIEDATLSPTSEERPASPPAKAVRLTRRQLAKQEEDLNQSQRAQSPPRHTEPENVTEHVAQAPIEQVEEEVATEQTAADTTTGAEADPVEAHSSVVPEPEVLQEEPKPELESIHETADATQAAVETNTSAHEEPLAELQEGPASELEETQQETAHPVESLDVEVEVEAVTPSVEITSELEPKTLAAERPSDAARTPVMSRTPSRRASRSPSKSPMRIEESIEALDALEEALENVGKAVSHFDQSNDDKSPRKKAFPKGAATPNKQSKAPRKASVATRVSKTPSAAPKSIKPMASSLARASSVRAPPAKDIRKGSTDTVDYLASKRRPVSVSFPTPPPPPKGRAPTKPTFQLSSDAVAAKLKAQKEERQRREAEREAEGVPLKQRPISMPPVAKSTKPLTKATFQLPGEAVAAKLKAQKEERLKREAENVQADQPKIRPVSISMPPPAVKSTKPLTKATFQLPGEAVAAKLRAQKEERQKREEEAEAARKAAAAASKPRQAPVRKSVALPTRAQPGVSIPPPPTKFEAQPSAPLRSTSIASKRSSVQLTRSTSVSTTASNRNSLFVAKSTITPVDAVQQKLKTRDLFNRDKMENEAKERERKEKEEAAKQARAQAAERGRIASREWAEKQRKKMLDAVRSKAEAA